MKTDEILIDLEDMANGIDDIILSISRLLNKREWDEAAVKMRELRVYLEVYAQQCADYELRLLDRNF